MVILVLAVAALLVGGPDIDSAGTQPPPPVDPSDQAAIDEGNVARCKNGTYSDNTDFRGTCSSNDGVDVWLAPFGLCDDGHVIAMSEDASCDDHDGFDTLLPQDFVPQPEIADVARCVNGTYSDNTDFDATCSSSGGVDVWLSPYGQCRDGQIVEMSSDTDCGDHGGFGALMPPDFTPQTVAVVASTQMIPTTADVADDTPCVGDTDTTGELEVTVHAFEDPVVASDGLIEAAAGSRFVAVEITLTNMSTETQPYSTLLLVELVDSLDRSWDVSIFGVSDRPSVDGDAPPGESRRGWIAFEVPGDATGFRLRVKGNVTADGATFTLS